MTALLRAEGLRKFYPIGGRGRAGQLHAVDGVSFALARGEALGLVGESGCGKSTLAQMIARLIDLSAGTIEFDGRDIGNIAVHRFATSPERARIQMVFQDAADSLNPRHTAFDAIADPLRRLNRLGGAALGGRVARVADLVNFPHALLGRFPHQLSGGQKARVGIARAIAVEPDVVVLDEPTSALDVSIQAVILKLLDRLRRELSLSYLFVSHDLNVVRMLCDRVMVMYLGRCVESGPTADVFQRPRHPYTSALIDSIPGTGAMGKHQRLAGEPASPIDPDPRRCRFYGRCPHGADLCRVQMPVLPETAGQAAACHYPNSDRS